MKRDQSIGGMLSGMADVQNANLNQQKYLDSKAASEAQAKAQADAQRPFLAEALAREKLITAKAQNDFYKSQDSATPPSDANDPYLNALEQYNSGIGNKDPRLSTLHYSYLLDKYGQEAADYFMSQNRPAATSSLHNNPNQAFDYKGNPIDKNGGIIQQSGGEPFRGLSYDQIPTKENPFKGATETPTSQYARLAQADNESQAVMTQMSLSQGIDQAAKNGGFHGTVDFLNQYHPTLAKQAVQIDAEVKAGMDQTDIVKTLPATEKIAAYQDGYRALSQIGTTLLQADPKDRAAMYKQMLPMVQAVNPNAPTTLDNKAISMFMVAATQTTPNGVVSNIQNYKMSSIHDIETLRNKYQQLKNSGATMSNSEELRALGNKLDEANLHLNNADVMALKNHLNDIATQTKVNLAQDQQAAQAVKQALDSKLNTIEQALKDNEQETNPAKFSQNLAKIKSMQAEYNQLMANATNGNMSAVVSQLKGAEQQPVADKAAVTGNNILSQADQKAKQDAAKATAKDLSNVDWDEERKKQLITNTIGKTTASFAQNIAQASKDNISTLDTLANLQDIAKTLKSDPTNSYAQAQLRGQLLKLYNKGATSDPDYDRSSVATGIDWTSREMQSFFGKKQLMSPKEIALASAFINNYNTSKLQRQLGIEDSFRQSIHSYDNMDPNSAVPKINWNNIPVPSNKYTQAQAQWTASDMGSVLGAIPPEYQAKALMAIQKGIPMDKIMQAVKIEQAKKGNGGR